VAQGPSVPQQHKSHNQLTVGPPTRSGRYVNQEGGNANNNADYFSKLINWLNPFNANARNRDAIAKDSQGQGPPSNPWQQQQQQQQQQQLLQLQQQQIGQYAPHQPSV
jgi:hypothetical protein